MNLTDFADRAEVVRNERRSKRGRLYRAYFFMPSIAAVLALLLMAYQSASYRDEIVTLKESHAAEVADLKACIEMSIPLNEPKCTEYYLHMEGWTLVHCLRTFTGL